MTDSMNMESVAKIVYYSISCTIFDASVSPINPFICNVVLNTRGSTFSGPKIKDYLFLLFENPPTFTPGDKCLYL